MQVEYCSYFSQNKCRSCSLLELSEEERDTKRLDALEALLRPVLGKKLFIPSIVKPACIDQSRCKVKLSVAGSIKNPVVGLLDNDLQGVELLDCPLHLKPLNQVVCELKNIITEFRLAPYDISNQEGELKGLILIGNQDASSVIVRFVLRSEKLVSRIEKVVSVIRKRLNQVKVVSANIQPVAHAILEGEEERILTDQKRIWLDYLGRSIAVGPKSFVQVTPPTAQQLYSTVSAAFEEWRPKGFLDLYCGSGAFSFFVAPYVDWGIGVETSENAVDCAERGAKKNGFNQLEFFAADVKDYLSSYSGKKPEAVIVNPPRRGLEEVVVQQLNDMRPQYLVYSSCNPETLTRDLRKLSERYAVKSITPFDMFPMTEHLEVLAVLHRRN